MDGGLIGVLVLYGVDAADGAVAVIAYRGLLLGVPGCWASLPCRTAMRLRAETHDIASCGAGEEVEVLGRGRVRKAQLA